MRFDGVSVKIRDAYAARHEPEAARLLGEWYWTFLITMLTLTIVGGISFGVWEFMRPVSDVQEPSVSVGVGEKKGVTRSDIIKVLEGFDERAAKYESRRVAPVGVKDPS